MDNNINYDLYNKLSDSYRVYVLSNCDVLDLFSDYMKINRKAFELNILPKDIYTVNLYSIEKAYLDFISTNY